VGGVGWSHSISACGNGFVRLSVTKPSIFWQISFSLKINRLKGYRKLVLFRGGECRHIYVNWLHFLIVP
jgi:hypothetical protein